MGNIKILLVDDGFFEHCGEIETIYKELFHIRVIHNLNVESEFARNAGITITVGEYIAELIVDDLEKKVCTYEVKKQL